MTVANIEHLAWGGGVAVCQGWPTDSNTQSWYPRFLRTIIRPVAGMADSGVYSLEELEEMMDVAASDAALLEAREKGTTSIEGLIQELGL